ncbi:MAG TPA: sigma-54 dependent transcriptional regulator [Phycisphaerae bacterium]|nr:sigma-54 dependent transcriptional regulator [Phycisphaerae bacterium]
MKKNPRILIVDDDPLIRRSCERILGQDYDLKLIESGREGLELLEAGGFDLALVDLKLADIDGMEILNRAPDRHPDVPIIVITGYSTIQSAVEAIKKGAFDYLAKPFTPVELAAAVEKAVRERRLLRDYRGLQEALAHRYRVSRLIGESPGIRHVLDLVQQVSQTDTTVLLTGESGTGKELVARAIHFSSPRRDARFVAVDCGAIPPSLIASELFGHVRGAFTGASDDRQGLIQTADGGTLFLDEVSNLPPDLQATLLRVIETREVRAVGATDPVTVEVRYVAATNCDLAALVKEGKFREDLFYRFNVFPIHLPPLRERREDIPLLADHFLSMFCAKMHKRVEGFTREAVDALTQYDWPGNVRELSNVVERLVILCSRDRIGQAHLRESMVGSAPLTAVPQTADELNELKKKLRDEAIVEVEKAFLVTALRRNGYNVTKAASQTGMQRSNFQALLRKHGLRIRDIAAGRDRGV